MFSYRITKPCRKCGDTRRYHSSHEGCVSCAQRRNAAWRIKNTTYSKAKKRTYYEKHKRESREATWRARGIIDMTHERYDKMLWEQGGKCAICKRVPGKRPLAV